MEEQKKINFAIDNGDAFFAHEVSVNFNPTQFILDFKCITPRVDPRSTESQVLSIKHNVVMLDAFHAKGFLEFLKKRLEDYEKEFGKVEKPKVLKTIEKKRKNLASKKKDTKPQGPTYFG